MEDFLKVLSERVGQWLQERTSESDVVVSTRIRLARNITGYPFPEKMQNGQASDLEKHLKEEILSAKVESNLAYFSLAESSAVCRQAFLERHLISRELAMGKIPRGVAFDGAETISIMVNEEDHLRLQVLRPGFELEACWKEMGRIDKLLESRLDYSYSPDYGFLTSCPTNVGTGMRVSVMFHLPALAIAEKELKRVFNAAAKTNFAVRGLHGEGTKAVGDFFQVSNQITLGRTESDLLQDLEKIVPQILEFERKVRDTLITGQKKTLEDRVFRAFGLLRNARSMTSEEALGHLSAVRLGVNLGLLKDVDLQTVNRLLILTQPGHLQVRAGKELTPEERDAERADLLRENLGSKPT